MEVCVIGLGYIGLPTACMLARAGHKVRGVDTNSEILRELNGGEVHIHHENGLSDLWRNTVKDGAVTLACSPADAEVFIICVPTPFREGFRADLSFVEAAARSIAAHLRSGNLVILESTVPPGTTVGVVQEILSQGGLKAGSDYFLAFAPERVMPGNILHELVHNDRIVGGINFRSAEMARDLYASFVQGEIHLTDCTTAEMVKLMENTYRDVNIALANELALICERIGIDSREAIHLANRHPRVKLMQPGPGVGGHCIAVDPYFIIEKAREESRLIQTARQINSNMPRHVFQLCRDLVADLESPLIVILGAAYKADVADCRESPTMSLIEFLEQSQIDFRCHDPYITKYQGELHVIVQDADCLILMVDHQQYRTLSPTVFASLMRNKRILDTRGILGHCWEEAGFTLSRLGGRQSHHLFGS